MEIDRFDAMTRRLATPTPRRTVLKGMAAMATTGLFALVGGREAAAAKPPCLSLCQAAREEFHAICPNAGGGTTRSFSCDP